MKLITIVILNLIVTIHGGLLDNVLVSSKDKEDKQPKTVLVKVVKPVVDTVAGLILTNKGKDGTKDGDKKPVTEKPDIGNVEEHAANTENATERVKNNVTGAEDATKSTDTVSTTKDALEKSTEVANDTLETTVRNDVKAAGDNANKSMPCPAQQNANFVANICPAGTGRSYEGFCAELEE